MRHCLGTMKTWGESCIVKALCEKKILAIVDTYLTVSNYSREILILPIEKEEEYFF